MNIIVRESSGLCSIPGRVLDTQRILGIRLQVSINPAAFVPAVPLKVTRRKPNVITCVFFAYKHLYIFFRRWRLRIRDQLSEFM